MNDRDAFPVSTPSVGKEAMTPPDSSRQFARLTYEAMFARAAGLLGGVVANIMIARALGAGGKGILTILAVWSGLLASLFSSGLNLAVMFELGVRPWHARRLLLRVPFYVLAATSLIAMGGAFFRDKLGHPEVSACLFALLFAAQLSCNLAYAFLIGLRNQSAVNWLLAAGSICYPVLVGVLLLVYGRLDVMMILACMILLPTGMAVVGFFVVRRQSVDVPGIGEGPLVWSAFLGYAMKSTAMAMGSLIYAQVVLLVMAARGSPSQVGVFSVSMIFVDTATVIPAMIAAFVLPRWSGLSGTEVFIRASRAMRLTHPISLVIAVGAAVLGLAFAEPVFGKDFADVGKLAWVMVPGAWAATGITVVSTCFLAQNQHRVPTALSWMGVVLTGGLAWWLLPLYGCVGAAMAVSISRLLVLLWAWRSFRNASGDVANTLWLPGRDDIHAWRQVVSHTLRRMRGGR